VDQTRVSYHSLIHIDAVCKASFTLLMLVGTQNTICISSAYEALLMKPELVCVNFEPPEMSMGTYDRANYVKLASASSAYGQERAHNQTNEEMLIC
jgi:hypothetical protein